MFALSVYRSWNNQIEAKRNYPHIVESVPLMWQEDFWPAAGARNGPQKVARQIIKQGQADGDSNNMLDFSISW